MSPMLWVLILCCLLSAAGGWAGANVWHERDRWSNEWRDALDALPGYTEDDQ